MIKVIPILIGAFLVAGCPDGRFVKKSFTSPDCGVVTGYTVTGIGYGDSKMIVVPISKIKAGAEWRFYLKPEKPRSDPDANLDKLVTIDGKDPATLPAPADANEWIDTSGTYTGSLPGKYLVECIPEDATPGQEFQYLVNVADIGTLDPRAKVQ